jgi:hypothetical protein
MGANSKTYPYEYKAGIARQDALGNNLLASLPVEHRITVRRTQRMIHRIVHDVLEKAF